jgi:hypothetical protein
MSIVFRLRPSNAQGWHGLPFEVHHSFKDDKLATGPCVGFWTIESGDVIGIRFIQDHALLLVLKVENHLAIIADFFLFYAIYHNRNVAAFQV